MLLYLCARQESRRRQAHAAVPRLSLASWPSVRSASPRSSLRRTSSPLRWRESGSRAIAALSRGTSSKSGSLPYIYLPAGSSNSTLSPSPLPRLLPSHLRLPLLSCACPRLATIQPARKVRIVLFKPVERADLPSFPHVGPSCRTSRPEPRQPSSLNSSTCLAGLLCAGPCPPTIVLNSCADLDRAPAVHVAQASRTASVSVGPFDELPSANFATHSGQPYHSAVLCQLPRILKARCTFIRQISRRCSLGPSLHPSHNGPYDRRKRHGG